ncbi:hypothetical protein BOQ62_06095 [Chryseobacterium sp. CH21]|nr:hypothetical protein BOQ62_06095 [Chryseobacterium sp. CH21]
MFWNYVASIDQIVIETKIRESLWIKIRVLVDFILFQQSHENLRRPCITAYQRGFRDLWKLPVGLFEGSTGGCTRGITPYERKSGH